jgi:hypothetical protein
MKHCETCQCLQSETTSKRLEDHPDYCRQHGGHLMDSPCCRLAQEREKRAENARGES